MNFETIIGIEVHVELNTNSKIFSPSAAHFGQDQNASTNIIDWSFPGVLPVLNKGVVDAGIKAALALNMSIHQKMHFDRKNYFYPDNPKAYQISQFDEPIGYDGWIDVTLEDWSTKKIRIERAHLEEDAGKNTHGTDGYSYVDLNRQGVPLIEIVSEADMRSPEEAYAYLTALKEIIQYTGISDVKMEEGSMRVDANISLRPYGQEAFGTKTELKNLNSFSNVRKGLEYEVERQAKILRSGGQIRQETRRYDEASKSTILMRVKEGSADYRYFPEPDLPLFEIDDAWIEEVRSELPAFPAERRARYTSELGLSAYDASQLTATKALSDFFEAAVALGGDAALAIRHLDRHRRQPCHIGRNGPLDRPRAAVDQHALRELRQGIDQGVPIGIYRLERIGIAGARDRAGARLRGHPGWAVAGLANANRIGLRCGATLAIGHQHGQLRLPARACGNGP